MPLNKRKTLCMQYTLVLMVRVIPLVHLRWSPEASSLQSLHYPRIQPKAAEGAGSCQEVVLRRLSDAPVILAGSWCGIPLH